MNRYDYQAGKKRIVQILTESNEIAQVEKLPKEITDEDTNGYFSFVSAVFVDIRKSSAIFENTNSATVAKILRSFTSEVIEILTGDDNEDLVREIGIRDGSSIYVVYTTPSKPNIQSVIERAISINTYMDMLNKLLLEYEITHQLKIGIGMATSQELMVKASKKGTKVTHSLWIGKALEDASRYAKVAGKDGIHPITIANMTHANLPITHQEAFTFIHSKNEGYLYHCNSIHSNMYKWIKEGMPD